MGPRRVSLVLLGVFAGLLGFHLWLLQRMVAAGNALLSALLVVAISVFIWRIVHYSRRFRAVRVPPAPEDPATERRRILVYVPILVALLGLHAWLISVTWAAGELLFVLLLSGAVAVFAIRLALYARRWVALRRGSAGRSSP